MLMPTVVSATIALRPAAFRIPESSTLRQASRVGEKLSRKGSLSCSGFFRLAKAIHTHREQHADGRGPQQRHRQTVRASEFFHDRLALSIRRNAMTMTVSTTTSTTNAIDDADPSRKN